MINGVSSGLGEKLPAREESEPDILDLIIDLLRALGPEGADIIKNIQLGERDLRTVALEPKFLHALERADKLTDSRLALDEHRERLALWAEKERTTRGIGQKALQQVPLQRTE